MATNVPALQLPAAAPVSAAARLAYVLHHFRLAYDGAAHLPAIGYFPLMPAGARIVIGSGEDEFFSSTAPYPAFVSTRPWGGRDLPFLFDDQSGESPLELRPDGTALIKPDIVSAAFYLLSGWQEYHSAKRDRHGRFPYEASVQKQYDFVAVPVVNYYFDVLKTAVEHVLGRELRPRRWAGTAPFAGFITHDVDNLNGGWGTGARHALRQGQLGQAATLFTHKISGRAAPWNNLAYVQAATARFGAPSTFFILGETDAAPNGTPNADYDATTPAFRAQLAQLAAAGAEIGSHGSYGTNENPAQLRQEIAQLVPERAAGNRFHYLCWEPRRTPAVLAQAGVAYDSTLGFAEQFGFRNSYCLPFFPFDFERGEAHPFLEIPLNVMDTTLHHPSYLQLGPEEILPALRPMLAEIERFGGVATVLWHNENFDPANARNGPQQFAELMQYLQQRGAAFRTGSQIVAELCRKPVSE